MQAFFLNFLSHILSEFVNLCNGLFRSSLYFLLYPGIPVFTLRPFCFDHNLPRVITKKKIVVLITAILEMDCSLNGLIAGYTISFSKACSSFVTFKPAMASSKLTWKVSMTFLISFRNVSSLPSLFPARSPSCRARSVI